jgi:Mn-dependent DtxR family transcriptional regulator
MEQSEILSASLEDYLEAILQLERGSRVARVSEIADQLHVSRPSVTGALKNLSGRGLAGVLSIPAEKAETTACRLEHVLEPDVLAHFVAYAESVAGTEKR